MADSKEYERNVAKLVKETKREMRRELWRQDRSTFVIVGLSIATIILFFTYVRANSAARHACKVVWAVSALYEDQTDDANPALAERARKQPYESALTGCERYAD